MQTNDTDDRPAPVLTPADRKELRARAHHLKPVVMIGEAGLTEAVLAEARRAIEVHELLKIRVFGDDRELRQSLMQQVCEALSCAPVQMIGKLLVVWRPRPAEPAAGTRPRGPHVPKKAAAAGATSAKARPATRRPAAAKAAPRAAPEPAARKRVWSTEATGRPGTRTSRDAPPGERSPRPSTRKAAAGPRTGPSPGGPRGGRAPAAGRTARPKSAAGARTGAPRERSKKR